MVAKVTVIPCLFTRNKTAKRKTWITGEVRIVRLVASIHAKHEGSGRVEPEPKDSKLLLPDEFRALQCLAEDEFETECVPSHPKLSISAKYRMNAAGSFLSSLSGRFPNLRGDHFSNTDVLMLSN